MPRAALAGLLAALVAAPALAAPEPYDVAFVSAFADACVPQRLSYPGTKANAEALGWTVTERSSHPELEAMMTIMDKAAAEAAAEMQGTFDLEVYEKPVAGTTHHLVVARSSFIIESLQTEGEEPDPWVYIGCYLYNFDATAPIDPAPVTALIGKPISRTIEDAGLVGHVWGPPCPMPRTGDTYMSFFAEGSPHAVGTGFTGVVIKFETSEPDPGEVVPATYCTDDPPSAAN